MGRGARRVGSRRRPLLVVGVDTGGTFTDLVWLDGGRLHLHKVPSTPDDPARAVLVGLAEAGLSGRPLALRYSSTVATNVLLERRGARVVLLTTAGFEDLLEIGRQTRTDLYALEPRRPAPLVPRERRLGVRERMLFDGRCLRKLSAAAAAKACRRAGRLGAQSVAICLLHSYANPAHERRLARAARRLGVPVSVSHRLLREHREYERLSTTVINAYVAPAVVGHLRRLGDTVGRLEVMESSGGTVRARTAREEPARTLLSGPAAGVVGAARVARAAGLGAVLTLDMGGTSTDVSLVAGGLAYRPEAAVGGFPVRLPMVDIHTVGAGGGSIAWCDGGGALKVGPQSAGADPGPACYGRGKEATVTDAHLLLGRLFPGEFLGGRLRLDRERAWRAVASLGRRLGLSPVETAAGIVRVANASMERALRVVSVERGHDPRPLTLLAFGGAAGLHACELASALGMARVYVPPAPGLLSACGVLGAPTARDASLTVRWVAPRFAELRARLATLERKLVTDMVHWGVDRGRMTIEHVLECRYPGEGEEISVPFGPRFAATFHRLHALRFGQADRRRPVEVVTLRARARCAAPLARLLPGPVATRRARPRGGVPAPVAVTRVWWEGRMHATAVWRRDALPPAARIAPPALLCEFSATTFIPPGWRGRVDSKGGVLLEVRGGAG